MRLSDAQIGYVFKQLRGRYGSQFVQKFSTGANEKGVDEGMEEAKAVWAELLGAFGADRKALRYALDNLSPKFPPNADEFLALCRAGASPQPPKPSKAALPYQPTAEDAQRAIMTRVALSDISLQPRGDCMAWIRRPRSRFAHSLACDAAKRDSRVRAIIEELVSEGIAEHSGKLLKIWSNGAWVAA